MAKRKGAQHAPPETAQLSSNEEYNTEQEVFSLFIQNEKLNICYYTDTEKNYFYVPKEKRNGISFELVAPAVEVVCCLEDPATDKVSLLLQYKGKTFTLDSISDTTSIEEFTGRPILRQKDFLTLLSLQIDQSPTKTILNTTGWFEGKYQTPIVKSKNIVWKPQTFFSDYERNEPEKQLNLIHDALKEGKTLGLLYVASLMAAFPDAVPYVVLVSGQRGVGKTTACQLATNIYGVPKSVSQFFATNVGLELSLAECKDTAILFDEALVHQDDKKIEDIIFQVSGGRTKTRGRKDLTVDKGTSLKVGLFTTSERILEMSRGGTLRRLLQVEVGSRNDITTLFQKKYDISEALTWGGCIIELISYYSKHKEKFSAQAGKKEAERLHAPLNFAPAIDIIRTLLLFEDFFEEKFTTLRKTIQDFFESIDSEIQKDLVEQFLEVFPDWVLHNSKSFITDDTIPLTNDILGFLKKNKQGTYYPILSPSAFADFCKDNPMKIPFPKNILLKQLSEKHLIKHNQKYYWRHPETRACYYYFLIPITLKSPGLPETTEELVAMANFTGEADDIPQSALEDADDFGVDQMPF